MFAWCAGGVCAQIDRLGIPVLDVDWGSRGWCLLFLIQVTKTADLKWFEHGKDIRSEVPAIEVSVPYLLPLNLRKTSRAPIYIWQKQATQHSSETCLCTLDLPIVDLMVPVQYKCINLSEITRGHPLAIWDVIGKPHVYLWTHVSMLLPFDKQMEFPSQPCWMIINSCSYMHRAKQRLPVTSGWAVAKAVLWRTSYDIFQDPQTKMTGDCDMSTASSKKKHHAGGKC